MPQLALAQARLGHDVGLWSVEPGPENLPDLDTEGVALVRLSGPFAEALRAFGKADVVHDHGIWLPFHKQIALECARHGIPRIVSPRGMLEPWALNHKKWKKRLAWWIYQKRDLHRATALHATAESEAAQLRKLGFKQRIIIAANGVMDQRSEVKGQRSGPADTSLLTSDLRPPISGLRTALFLSRIHPKKGLPLLLEAWVRVGPEGWRLVIVGPDEGGHTGELKRLCRVLELDYADVDASELVGGTPNTINLGDAETKQEEAAGRMPAPQVARASCPEPSFAKPCAKSAVLGGTPTLLESALRPPSSDLLSSVSFSGSIEGGAKWELMRAADLFVLPTYSENFGIAVAEALACGVPVITTKGAPWAGLLERNCGWWVDVTVDALAGALEEALALSDDERLAMGQRGSEWMRAEFGWEGIARRIVAGYEEE